MFQWMVGLALMAGAQTQGLPPIDSAGVQALPKTALKLEFDKPAKPAPIDFKALSNTTPHCHCKEQCEAMWADATDAVEQSSRMRIRLATDNMLDTYASNRPGYLHGRVLKRPDGQGGYLFDASFDGDPPMPGLERSARQLFNTALQSPTTLRMCTEG